MEIYRCLGGDVFFVDFMGSGRGMCVFVVDSVGSGWTRKGVAGYCVERAGRDFLSGVCLDWTGLDWGDGGEKGDG